MGWIGGQFSSACLSDKLIVLNDDHLQDDNIEPAEREASSSSSSQYTSDGSTFKGQDKGQDSFHTQPTSVTGSETE